MTTQIVYQPSETTHWKNLFPNKKLLLGSHNLNEGEELIATIDSVSVEKITNQHGQDEQVPVVKFSNKIPPMVLNITNSRTIASLYGELYEGWIGRQIQVYATKVNAFGQVTNALRVREAIPSGGEDLGFYENGLKEASNLDDLKSAFMSLPKHIKPQLNELKDTLKAKFEEQKGLPQ